MENRGTDQRSINPNTRWQSNDGKNNSPKKSRINGFTDLTEIEAADLLALASGTCGKNKGAGKYRKPFPAKKDFRLFPRTRRR